MQKRTLISLGMLVVVSAAVAWKLTRSDPHIRTAGAVPLLGIGKSISEIDELEIGEQDKPAVVLKKEGNEWRLVQPTADRADQRNVEAALKTLGEAKLGDVLSESPSSHERLQIKDEQALRIVPKKAGTTVATILVNTTGKSVRFGDDAKVWQLQGFSRWTLARETKLWRDREIVKLDKENVDRIEVAVVGHPRVVASRERPATGADAGVNTPAPAGPDKWVISEGGDAIGGPFDETVPSSVLTALSRLDAAEFADGVAAEAVGLDKPRATAAAVLSDGARKEVLVGNEEGEDVFVKRSDSPKIWKIKKATAEALLKPPLQWRDKTLAKIPSKEIARLEIARGSEKIVLERSNETTWKAIEPADLAGDLDSTKVQSLALTMQNLRALSVVESPEPAKAGLAKPTATVKAVRKDGTSLLLTIGALQDKSYFVTATGRNEVFTLSEYSVNRLLKSPSDLRTSTTTARNP
ncbi:MAG: DUF4340 domain-containing protein [Pseudomonadota bacterium]